MLANEQVIAGECERCGTKVEQRFLEQWFFRITDYAERLLDNLDTHRLVGVARRQAQRNWIGQVRGRRDRRSACRTTRGRWRGDGHAPAAHGRDHRGRRSDIRVFTTRPDTIFGATYLVLAPEHPLVDRAHDATTQRDDVAAYRARAAKQDLVTRKVTKEKTGVFTGAYAINPGDAASRSRSGSPTTC